MTPTRGSSRRPGLLGAVICAWMLTGCPAPVAEVTGIRLVVSHPPSVEVDRLRISIAQGGAPVFAEQLVPASGPRTLAADGESVVLVFADERAGETVQLRVVGLRGEEPVAVGYVEQVLALRQLVETPVLLGDWNECGDGTIIEHGERCDDGNTDDDDGCSALCLVETGWVCSGEPSICTRCGSGDLDNGEQCDDGNTDDGDGCSGTCRVEPGYSCAGEPSVCTFTCGDGVLDGSDACDDGGLEPGDGCSDICNVERGWYCSDEPSYCVTLCDDGVIAGDEQCDDANNVGLDGCSTECTVEPGYACTGEPSTCHTVCGDGLLLGVEECDDAAPASGDGCDDECQLEDGWTCTGIPTRCYEICGDGYQVGGETCDDASPVDGDGCSSDCRVEDGWSCSGTPSTCSTTCGDGVIAGAELCDDGNTGAGDGCDASCRIEPGHACTGQPSICLFTCGNGLVEAGEACDDDNLTNGDGCSDICFLEAGFVCDASSPSSCFDTCDDGALDPYEECDDGNALPGDGCDPNCRVENGWHCSDTPSLCAAVCGDGMRVGSEQCDFGDVDPGDGCDPSCQVEHGWVCSASGCHTVCGDGLVASAEECDDGTPLSGDGCSSVCTVEPGYACVNEPSQCTDHCDDDSQCPYLCDEATHTCVDEADILYVECGAACPGAGTSTAPYCSLADAYAAAVHGQFIEIRPGQCNESLVVNAGKGVHLVGQPGAMILSPTCPALHFDGAHGSVEGLILGGGGVRATQGAVVTVQDNWIGPSACRGVECVDSDCTVRRNRVLGNNQGGLQFVESDFVCANNIVAENGNPQAAFGGVSVSFSSPIVALFVNNTVVDNTVGPGAGVPGGVVCGDGIQVFNSILWNNARGDVSANCQVDYSTLSQTYTGGTGNLFDDPHFVDPIFDDYHIDPASSPCIDQGSPVGAPPNDIDGDPRPLGNGVDMGADEAG